MTDGHNEGIENGSSRISHCISAFIYPIVCYTDVAEPLVRAWMIDAIEVADPVVESVGSSQTAPSRIPRLALTTAWKKYINALISGDRKPAVLPIRAPTPLMAASTSSEPDAPQMLDWSEDVEQSLLTSPEGTAAGKMDEGASASGRKWAEDCIFEKCGCALENAVFLPESWIKFKIPAPCHPSPPIHFLSPRDMDKCNPSTRVVVDNVNAFRHHSTEPNVPYANKGIEDVFYGVGAKNVCCFDGRVVGGIVRYNTSYAVADFEMVEEAEVAFKAFQGRRAYPDGYHLRLKFVDMNDRTFGRRMGVSMGPMERSDGEGKTFAEFIQDLDRVDIVLAKVVLPNRPGFALPARPATLPSCSPFFPLLRYFIRIRYIPSVVRHLL